MEHLKPLEIEARARLNNLKMKEVCDNAGVSFQTFWRWKTKGAKIQLESYEKLVAAASTPKVIAS